MTKSKLQDEGLEPGFVDDVMETPKFREFSDMLGRFHKHINDDADKETDTAVALAVVKVESDLLSYFTSPQGLRDIQNSPHRDKSPEAVVQLLMQDVAMMGRAEVIKRGLSREIKEHHPQQEQEVQDGRED